ncbi:hypothetical protein GCM10027285_10820 [Oleiagrimonas citrea]|uniref:Relaxase domain-containing protein n=1 Tax=Oleiagrimonas citrea TaxID=1665687 RepID=A0A846ZKZ5_9GAMM|nr:MobF family relaxase [Oleiagrimonas citrea]NKZ38357.1 relaxase domain-containing protein [Oleiagrimonas citrea]
MLSHSTLKQSKGKDALAVVQYMLSEYYIDAEGHAVGVSQWAGAGAEAQNLRGKVKAQHFRNLLEGFGKKRTQKLVKNAGQPSRKRLGDDFTFSVDKSYSLAFAAADEQTQQQMIEDGNAACDAVLDWMAKQAHTYKRKGDGREKVAGLVVARFAHFSSREGEPNLHFHNAVINAALSESGAWAAMDNRELLELVKAGGALFRAEFAHRMRTRGFKVSKERERDAEGRETGQVWHKLAGVSSDVERKFSTRRQQIEEAMSKQGLSAQAACLATRKGKEELTFSQTMERAKAALQDLRNAGQVQWQSVEDLKGESHQEAVSDAAILRRLHKTEAAFGRAELIEQVAKEHGGALNAAQCLREADRILERAQVRELGHDHKGRERWASVEQIETERAIGDAARARLNDESVRLDAETVARAIKEHEQAQGFKLSKEQRAAVEFVTLKTGGVAVVTGQAGAGKTASAGGYIKAFQHAGREVIGTALAWDAADKLAAETGLECFSAASLLAQIRQEKLKLSASSVVVVDEAGTVGARTIRDIQQAVDAAGGKLVLVGDAQQLQPVEAGAGFVLAMRETGEARLGEIRRQKHEQDRALARMFYDAGTSGQTLVEAMEKREQLTQHEDTEQARAALVAAYLADPAAARDKLIIAPTNAQCDALTHALREARKERGELQDSQPVEVRGRLLGQRQPLDLAAGDRVRFGKRDRALGVTNGTVATVERIEADTQGGHRLSVRIESDIPAQDGRLVEFSTREMDALGYGYAGTVHKAQGQGKASVFWLAEGRSMSRNLGLVAFTRTKERLQVFTTPEGREQLAESLDEFRDKLNAVDMLKEKEQQHEQARGALAQAFDKLGELVSAFKRKREQTQEQQKQTRQRSRAHAFGR